MFTNHFQEFAVLWLTMVFLLYRAITQVEEEVNVTNIYAAKPRKLLLYLREGLF